jgi:hypothetical protein
MKTKTINAYYEPEDRVVAKWNNQAQTIVSPSPTKKPAMIKTA